MAKPNGVRHSVTESAAAATSAMRKPTCASRPGSFQSHALGGMIGDCRKPGAGLPERPRKRLLHEQQRRRNSAEASPAPRARDARDGSPSRSPTTARRQRRRPEQRSGAASQRPQTRASASATAAAPRPPSAIWPSAPMLMMPARKQKATPDAREQIRRRAVERDADLMRRADAPIAIAAKAASGLWPESATSSRGADKREDDRDEDAQTDPLRRDEAQRREARPGGRQVGGAASRHAARPDIHRPICARSDATRAPRFRRTARPPSPRRGRRRRAPPPVRRRRRGSRRPPSRSASTPFDDEARRAGIESPGGLMRDQRRRLPVELPRDDDLLLVAAGQARGRRLRPKARGCRRRASARSPSPTGRPTTERRPRRKAAGGCRAASGSRRPTSL